MNAAEMKLLGNKYGVTVETIQKDYSATVLLSVISEFPKLFEMVFKGGTALKKIYFPDTRFSLDLDFTCNSDMSVEFELFLMDGIKDLDVNITKVKKMRTGKQSRKYSVKYLNYNNYPMSVQIDLSLREKVIENIETLPIRHFYHLKNNNFSVPCMAVEEILAEKMRALVYAHKPRHLYDVWYLFQQGIKLDFDLINLKLAFYNESFSLEKIKNSIDKTKDAWNRDLNPLLSTVPPFVKISKSVIQNIETSLR